MKSISASAVAALLIFGIVIGIAYLLDKATALNVDDLKYIQQHQCVREGFAGKAAIPTYRCDNGLWLQTEIKELVRNRTSLEFTTEQALRARSNSLRKELEKN
jgi:hypothetical protein